MNYNYWNIFVLGWSVGKKSIGGWTNPNSISLYNDSSQKDKSSLYIPEPWWGNDGSAPLHSVIINYNPGKAQSFQISGAVRVLHSYATEIVNSGLLSRTENSTTLSY
ncbi:MAG: hypothetical protein IKX71_09335 [Bacteroidales bacterium]|nr:hypothetical protein [Bacteroidales bacterium]